MLRAKSRVPIVVFYARAARAQLRHAAMLSAVGAAIVAAVAMGSGAANAVEAQKVSAMAYRSDAEDNRTERAAEQAEMPRKTAPAVTLHGPSGAPGQPRASGSTAAQGKAADERIRQFHFTSEKGP